MPSWIQDPKTKKLIPKNEYYRQQGANKSAYLSDDIEPFKSPIDGRVIHSRSGLREHNRQHGVTDMRDYGDSWFERKSKERSEAITGKRDRGERIEEIKKQLYRRGIIDG